MILPVLCVLISSIICLLMLTRSMVNGHILQFLFWSFWGVYVVGQSLWMSCQFHSSIDIVITPYAYVDWTGFESASKFLMVTTILLTILAPSPKMIMARSNPLFDNRNNENKTDSMVCGVRLGGYAVVSASLFVFLVSIFWYFLAIGDPWLIIKSSRPSFQPGTTAPLMLSFGAAFAFSFFVVSARNQVNYRIKCAVSSVILSCLIIFYFLCGTRVLAGSVILFIVACFWYSKRKKIQTNSSFKYIVVGSLALITLCVLFGFQGIKIWMSGEAEMISGTSKNPLDSIIYTIQTFYSSNCEGYSCLANYMTPNNQEVNDGFNEQMKLFIKSILPAQIKDLVGFPTGGGNSPEGTQVQSILLISYSMFGWFGCAIPGLFLRVFCLLEARFVTRGTLISFMLSSILCSMSLNFIRGSFVFFILYSTLSLFLVILLSVLISLLYLKIHKYELTRTT